MNKKRLERCLDGEADFSEKKLIREWQQELDRLMNEGIVNAPPLVTDINEEDTLVHIACLSQDF